MHTTISKIIIILSKASSLLLLPPSETGRAEKLPLRSRLFKLSYCIFLFGALFLGYPLASAWLSQGKAHCYPSITPALLPWQYTYHACNGRNRCKGKKLWLRPELFTNGRERARVYVCMWSGSHDLATISKEAVPKR